MELETAFAVIAGVLVVSALAAGLVERAPLSFPMLFLGLGFLIGDRGLELISIGLDNQVLTVVAVVALALVLFLDAVNLEFTELRRDWLAPFLVLGPSTLLVAGLLAWAAALLLDLPAVLALLLGTILASTDPVVLRDVLRDTRLPRSVRRALSVEAGTNDLVVLPILLVLIAITHADLGGPTEWLIFLGQLFVLGPAAGFAVGAAGSWTMGWIDQRFPIRREYQPVVVRSVLRLGRAGLSRYARQFIGWFGPRGLNSLLFALLVVEEGVRGGEELLAVVGVVVLVSVVAHGATATPFSGWYARKARQETLAEERASTAAELFTHTPDDVPRVTPAELAKRLAGPHPPLVLDVRSRSEYERDGVRIPGSVRVLPDQVTEWAADRLRDQPFVLYCT
ncbi:MAG TPA: cation:proton antiporter [Actinomycetes bacterium]|nr:cation:proton antiporter [Actinomycetes bacterium]